MFVWGDRSLVNEDVIAGVVAIHEAVPIPNVKSFSSSNNSSIFNSDQVDKVILHLLAVSRVLPVLGQGAVMRCVLARIVLEEPTPQAFHLSFLRI